jgi:hypothetical protein
MDKGLAIGQKLKVPLNAQNLAQSGQPAGDEAFIPVYHTVKEKEGLYRIGQSFNKVSVDQLKQWNRMKSDDVTIGSNLIVGYLRVKKDLSPLAGAAVQVPSAPVAKTNTQPAETQVNKPADKPAPVTKPATPPAETKTTTPPVTTVPENKPAEKATEKPVETKPAVTPPPVTTTTAPPIRTEATAAEGAFATAFRDQQKGNVQVTGVAGVFKSTSGWKDGKYYVLMNKVVPGTIVKITSVSTSKSVYAKVLGEIPPGKENEGLLIRLSNAASAQLQLADTARFEIQLVY